MYSFFTACMDRTLSHSFENDVNRIDIDSFFRPFVSSECRQQIHLNIEEFIAAFRDDLLRAFLKNSFIPTPYQNKSDEFLLSSMVRHLLFLVLLKNFTSLVCDYYSSVSLPINSSASKRSGFSLASEPARTSSQG